MTSLPSETDEQGRPVPPPEAGEVETLVGFLEFLRATIFWKCEGLGDDELRRSLPPSSMTLGGLLKHLAFVEDYWFGYVLHGADPDAPWADADWDADPDWDWTSAVDDAGEELRTLWSEAVGRSRSRLTEALETGGADHPASRPWSDGRRPSLRWIVCHLVEEYARHCGHADLLRESIDGKTGE